MEREVYWIVEQLQHTQAGEPLGDWYPWTGTKHTEGDAQRALEEARAQEERYRSTYPTGHTPTTFRLVRLTREVVDEDTARLVHHKDGDPADNTLDNLQVVPRGRCEACKTWWFAVLHVWQSEDGTERHVCGNCLVLMDATSTIRPE